MAINDSARKAQEIQTLKEDSNAHTQRIHELESQINKYVEELEDSRLKLVYAEEENVERQLVQANVIHSVVLL